MFTNSIKHTKTHFRLPKTKDISHSFSSIKLEDLEYERSYSTTDETCDCIPDIFPKEETEDMLITLSKKQRKISDYSNDDGIAFLSRESILSWAEKVLNTVKLTPNERESIFHRFSTCFDFIMDKLYLEGESIQDGIELKKMTITIFLLTYKFEGFTIGKVTIRNLVEAFLSSLDISTAELENTIQQTELKILGLLDYNPFCLENNIYELSLVWFDLMKKRFNLSDNTCWMIKTSLTEANKNIQISKKLLFEVYPLDKAAISLTSVILHIKYVIEHSGITSNYGHQWVYYEVEHLSKNFYNYCKQDLKVIRIMNIHEFMNFSMFFGKILRKEDENCK